MIKDHCIQSFIRNKHTLAKRALGLREFVNQEVKNTEDWWNNDRFVDIKRPYSALDVVKHRGSLGVSDAKYPSSYQAQKLHGLLQDKFNNKEPLHTLGIADPVQMSQLSRCTDIQVAYISGWVCSSTMVGSTNEVSPDFGDYPYNTVPNQVERIFKSQQLHDRKSFLNSIETGEESVDYLKPIIADADMGHGGPTTVMKVAKLFAEKGAAAIHLEDQLVGGKRCGHLSGAVLVPTSTHLSRIIATRYQWDILGTENLVIARTDSVNSKLISSNSDPRDHAYIKGISGINVQNLSEILTNLEVANASSSIITAAEEEWYNKYPLLTFDETVQKKFTREEYTKYLSLKEDLKKEYGRNYLSLREMKQIANQVSPNTKIHFDWDAPRSKEGYYMYHGCVEAGIERSLAFAPYSDLIWLETKTPNLKQAKEFAAKIHTKYPSTKLVYNLSPSFNWSAHGYTESELKTFIWDLAKEGFILQLVSLAGLHSNGVSFWELAKNFEKDGMAAYVKYVQQKEKDLDCDLLTHQRWSGAEYVDSMMKVVQNGSSSKTLSTSGENFTETQF